MLNDTPEVRQLGDVDSAVLAFKLLSERLKEIGDAGLSRELGNAINDAARPAVDRVRSGLPDHMPGAYAEILGGDLRLTISKRVAGAPGVTIRATARGTKKRKLRRLEGGVLAHPLFGNREHWYDQTDAVKPEFFSGPLSQSQPEVRQAIVDAMAKVAEHAAGR